MTSFPWRYVVPRKNYKRILQIAKVCPELRPNIDAEAKLKFLEAVIYAPYVAMWIIAIPFLVVAAVVVAIALAVIAVSALIIVTVKPSPLNFRERRKRNLEAAERVCQSGEVARRLQLHDRG